MIGEFFHVWPPKLECIYVLLGLVAGRLREPLTVLSQNFSDPIRLVLQLEDWPQWYIKSLRLSNEPLAGTFTSTMETYYMDIYSW